MWSFPKSSIVLATWHCKEEGSVHGEADYSQISLICQKTNSAASCFKHDLSFHSANGLQSELLNTS